MPVVKDLNESYALPRRRKLTPTELRELLESPPVNDPRAAVEGTPEMHEMIGQIMVRQKELNEHRSAVWENKGKRRYQG